MTFFFNFVTIHHERWVITPPFHGFFCLFVTKVGISCYATNVSPPFHSPMKLLMLFSEAEWNNPIKCNFYSTDDDDDDNNNDNNASKTSNPILYSPGSSTHKYLFISIFKCLHFYVWCDPNSIATLSNGS